MDKLLKISILFLLLNGAYSVVAEKSPEEKQLAKKLKEADQHYKYGEYIEAIPLYKEYIQKIDGNAEAYYKLGACYIHTHGKTKALEYIKKAHILDKEVAEDIEFELGDAYHYGSTDFDQAIAHYKNYRALHEKNERLVKIIDRRVYECENAKEFIENPVNVKLENLGSAINSEYDDYAPVISANEDLLIFTSKRMGTTGNTKAPDGTFEEDLYISRYIDGAWTAAENLSGLNTFLSDASVALSPDGKELITWREDGYGDLLYTSQTEDGKWEDLKYFPEWISSKGSREASAAISKDWLTLIFSSERKGGYGGLDLYMCTRKDKSSEWGFPVNLGDKINTEYDDDAPFIDIDNSLYFSSEGHKGMGGFDIFKAILVNKNKWSAPENLGYPVNSVDDDIFYVVAGNGRYGYFNSVKDYGYGGEDVYRIDLTDLEKVITENTNRKKLIEELTGKQEKLETVIVVTKDFISDEVLSESEIIIYDKGNKNLANSKDGDKDDTHMFKLDIAHLSQIKVHAEHQGYLPKTVTFTLNRDKEQHEFVVALRKIETDAKLSIREGVYFDINKTELSVESYVEIDKLIRFMNSHPKVKARLEGHTDDQGSDLYNLKLSMLRCEAVKKYMVRNGVNGELIETIGYGESKPIADNTTVEGRAHNRRIEFVIDSY